MTLQSIKRIVVLAAFALVTSVQLSGLASAEQSPSKQASCESAKKQTCENLVQDNILWRISDPDSPASKHWAQINLDSLCGCTADPYETVNCFQVQVNNNHKTWQDAIAICRAKP